MRVPVPQALSQELVASTLHRQLSLIRLSNMNVSLDNREISVLNSLLEKCAFTPLMSSPTTLMAIIHTELEVEGSKRSPYAFQAFEISRNRHQIASCASINGLFDSIQFYECESMNSFSNSLKFLFYLDA